MFSCRHRHTDGALLRGGFQRDGVTAESLVMRAFGTIRYVRALHQLDKLMRFSQIDYTGDNKEKAESHG